MHQNLIKNREKIAAFQEPRALDRCAYEEAGCFCIIGAMLDDSQRETIRNHGLNFKKVGEVLGYCMVGISDELVEKLNILQVQHDRLMVNDFDDTEFRAKVGRLIATGEL
jgi:hypothetical protein